MQHHQRRRRAAGVFGRLLIGRKVFENVKRAAAFGVVVVTDCIIGAVGIVKQFGKCIRAELVLMRRIRLRIRDRVLLRRLSRAAARQSGKQTQRQ